MSTHESPPPLRGQALLESPLRNKGTAFIDEERHELGLLGLLPPHVETIEEQVVRSYSGYLDEEIPLKKHIYLRNLQDENETLFYRLVLDYMTEMLPILYTPTVGAACQQFSEIYRRPRGLFVSYPERDSIDEILSNHGCRETRVIVVTDGERILGLGDQGAGGMGIPIGKLSLYTAIGGIDPSTTLPIFLDAGTDNQDLINDPGYIGWRHERIRGEEYDAFIESFVESVIRVFPNVLLQWEDFAGSNATRLLEKYRDRLCTFNDDVQGTAAVVTAALMASVASTGGKLSDQRICILGAGSAGCGVGEQLVRAMMAEGLDEAAAREQFYLVDVMGLLTDNSENLQPFQTPFARNAAELSEWSGSYQFIDVIREAKPTILIGLTGHPGSFPEEVIREMASHTERPIIFPLSNPTSRVEAMPSDLLEWTNGKAIIASGSPFDPVQFGDKFISIAQCNNSYIFPAMGLGVRSVKATRVTDGMFMAAATALRDASPALATSGAPILPPLEDIRTVSREIAIAVATEAQATGFAKSASQTEIEAKVDQLMWTPGY